MEWQTEYEWNIQEKSPYQRRCGLIAGGLFALVVVVALAVLRSL